MKKYTISCFIPGKENTFTVDAQKTLAVDLLKERIKKKAPKTFTDVDACDLKLYRVIIDRILEKEPCMEKLEAYCIRRRRRRRSIAINRYQSILARAPLMG